MGYIQRFKTAEEADRALREEDFRVPRGLYRFKTFEEADEWMNRMTRTTAATGTLVEKKEAGKKKGKS